MNTEPKTLPSYADQLRDALPQHTYHQRGAFGTYTASWTTPAGTWTVARQLKGTSGITSVGLRAVTAITGPDWTLSGPADADTVIMLLRLFGAIDEAAPIELDRDEDGEEQRLRRDLDAACQTIAQMHAAAVGEVRGTIRGVVEDVADLRAERDALEKGANVAAKHAKEAREELDRINTTLRHAGISPLTTGALGVADLARISEEHLKDAKSARAHLESVNQLRTEAREELDRVNAVLRDAAIDGPLGPLGVTELAGLANERLEELKEAGRLLAAKDAEIAVLKALNEPNRPLATGGLIRPQQ